MHNQNEMLSIFRLLSSVFQFTINYTAALRACGKVYGDNDSGNLFIEISRETLWRQLLSELSKVFDNAKTGKNENCSFDRLLEACLSGSMFSKDDKSKIEKQTETLNQKYESILSKKLRNKKLVHYDLTSICRLDEPIVFDDIEQLVLDAGETLNKIGVAFLGLEVRLFDYEKQVNNYVENLHKLNR